MSLTFTFELLHIENRRSNNPKKKFRRDAVGGVSIGKEKGRSIPAVKKKKNGRTIGQK
jgi:hypothetical protein